MKQALLTASLLFVACQGWATTPQVLFSGGTGLKPVVGSNNFFLIMGQTNAPSTSETNWQAFSPSSGTFSVVRMIAVSSVGTSTMSYTVTLRVNGASSLLTCTLNGASAGNACSGTASVTINHNDTIDWLITTAGTPLSVQTSVSAVFTPSDTDGYMLVSQNVGTGSTAVFIPPMASNSNFSTENLGNIPISPPGTFSNLTVRRVGAAGAGTTRTFTFRSSLANSAMTCAISGASATSCQDVTHSSTTVAGELVDIGITVTGAPTSANEMMGIMFTPTNAGEFPIDAASGNNYSTSVTNFAVPCGGNVNVSATESQVQQGAASPSPGLVIKNLYAVAPTAQGATKTMTVTLRQNTASPVGGLSCVMTNATSCNDTAHSVTVNDDDLLDTSLVPGGTPTASRIQVGYTGFFSQSSSVAIPAVRGLAINGGKLSIVGGKVSVL